MPAQQDYRRALVVRQPFWEELSPTTVKQRVDQILGTSNSRALVQALAPVEFIILLKESLETRPLLLELAHPQQIRTVLDLDCWHKDTLQSSQVLAWLAELQGSGADVLAQTLRTLDLELLIATFRQYIRVHAAPPLEEEEEPGTYDEILANELYRIEFLDQESSWSERILGLLNALRLADLDFYHGLMQSIMWGQDSDAEEWAYRWKSGRLQDEGFPDYYEALETYRLVDLEQPLPPVLESWQAAGLPASAEESALLPTYAWSLTPSGSLLAQALSGDFSTATQERLCWEMVYLCNRELVIEQVDFANAAVVCASLVRVHAYLNLGLEYLSGGDTRRLVPLLSECALQSICQVGFTLSMRLHQRALHLQTHINHAAGVRRALPSLARQVLDGLLSKHPQFFEGLADPGTTVYRDFLSLRDITLATSVLTSLANDPAYHVLRAAS
jgi:hypothetical protein